MTKYLRFMRHGQTELNVRNCWQGHTDAPLTELGRRQSAESGLHLRESDIQLDHVFCSPLGRARETLEIALPGIAERGYELVDGLMEMSFGSLDGTVNSDNVVGPYHDYFLQFGGESEEHAEKRICSTLEGLMLRDDVRSALVVSHGTMGASSRTTGRDSRRWRTSRTSQTAAWSPTPSTSANAPSAAWTSTSPAAPPCRRTSSTTRPASRATAQQPVPMARNARGRPRHPAQGGPSCSSLTFLRYSPGRIGS